MIGHLLEEMGLKEKQEPNSDIAPDGHPRLYTKKPREEPKPRRTQQAEPVVEDETEEMRLLREGPSRFWMLIKLIDLYILRMIFRMIPNFPRLVMIVVALYNFEEMYKVVTLRPQRFRLSTTAFFLKCIYYLILFMLATNIYFRIDDLFDGKMYKDPWKQQFHDNIRKNYAALWEHPILILDLIPK